MAKFSNLPYELLIEIWSHILQPKDIENFALTSKTIRTSAGRILREHRKLTREFSTFDVGGRKSRFSAAGLLKQILIDPRIALYIKKITVTDVHTGWESEETGINTLKAFNSDAGEDECHYRHTPYFEEDMELFKQFIKRTKQFFDFGHFRRMSKKKTCVFAKSADYLINEFHERLEYGQDYHIVVFLLLLSTNLKSVTIESGEMERILFQILQYISEGQGIAILKRPVEVRIQNVCDEVAESLIRESITYFLPSTATDSTKIPGLVIHDKCFSFQLRAWSSNVHGMWTL